MTENELIPHLFRTEFSKITAVLCKLFGIQNIEVAEDIVSDSFLLAAETWGLKGVPDNPTAWLYTVAKNKTRDYFRRHKLFTEKISPNIKHSALQEENNPIEVDLSPTNIQDSQLQMMFAICHPSIPLNAQIGLSLRILCGFGIDEIADAFLSNKESINKRLFRAKEKLRSANVKMEIPLPHEINQRLSTVLTTLYLLFNEGYYSKSQNKTLRKELCWEAIRLTYSLTENEGTNKAFVNALLSLMCFHASRFDARINEDGDLVLYHDQDSTKWDDELIQKGAFFLNKAATGNEISKYHLEAAIAYWHTKNEGSKDKWEEILQLYNHLLQLEYSPMAALNRTYALAKVKGKKAAILEAEKLEINNHHLYHSLLGNLYTNIDDKQAKNHYQEALKLAKTTTDKNIINKKIDALNN